MPATDAGSWQHSNLCRCKLLSCLMLAACKLRVNSVWEQNFKASAPIRVLWASFSRQNGRMEKLPQQPPTAVQSNFRDITHTYQTHTHTLANNQVYIYSYKSQSIAHSPPFTQPQKAKTTLISSGSGCDLGIPRYARILNISPAFRSHWQCCAFRFGLDARPCPTSVHDIRRHSSPRQLVSKIKALRLHFVVHLAIAIISLYPRAGGAQFKVCLI